MRMDSFNNFWLRIKLFGPGKIRSTVDCIEKPKLKFKIRIDAVELHVIEFKISIDFSKC